MVVRLTAAAGALGVGRVLVSTDTFGVSAAVLRESRRGGRPDLAAALAETGNHVGTAIGIALLGTVGRIASEGIATGSGALTGSLQLIGLLDAGVLLFCAFLTARTASLLRRSDRE